jgi:hypothetical protein
LIQASNPEPGTSSVKKIKLAMIEKHLCDSDSSGLTSISP